MAARQEEGPKKSNGYGADVLIVREADLTCSWVCAERMGLSTKPTIGTLAVHSPKWIVHPDEQATMSSIIQRREQFSPEVLESLKGWVDKGEDPVDPSTRIMPHGGIHALCAHAYVCCLQVPQHLGLCETGTTPRTLLEPAGFFSHQEKE